MKRIAMTDETWARLRAIREGRRPVGAVDGPEFELYGPLVTGGGDLILAQVGQSLDGRVATPSGDARDVSGTDGIVHLHRCRALVDAVIVGQGTVKADNPRLSVRQVAGVDPVRVVVDCRADLTGDEGLFHDGGAPVIVLQCDGVAYRQYPGAETVRLPLRNGGLDPRDIVAALRARGLRRLLVEGGARTIARFLDQGLVDRLHVTIAPIIIGSGPAGFSLTPVERLSSALRPVTRVFDLGSDLLVDCCFEPTVIRRSERMAAVAAPA